jgi:hypothetical protein
MLKRSIIAFLILTGLTVLLQLIPVIFSHKLILFTMLSAIPIYLITRINPPVGPFAVILSGFLILLFSRHEALFFLLANGPVGLTLGIGQYLTKNRMIITLITSIVLTLTLSVINFHIGIKIFGAPIPGPFWMQLVIVWLFSFIYSNLYLYLANLVTRNFPRLQLQSGLKN